MAEKKNAISTLRRFAQPASASEVCEFCSVSLGPVHRHLLELKPRKIVCACGPCALRFENPAGGRWKLIPRDARALPDFQMSDAQWESLALPINLAFFFRCAPDCKVRAMYPSPAGAMESLLPMTNWETLVSENPDLARMSDDVEALLVNRLGNSREYFLAPIDACYELVGLIRLHWRGFSGGDKVWQEIERFFIRLRTGDSTAAQSENQFAARNAFFLPARKVAGHA